MQFSFSRRTQITLVAGFLFFTCGMIYPLAAQRVQVRQADPYRAAVFREWTSADGSLTTEAKLIDFSADGIAKLERKANGKIVQIAAEKLSEEDQEYLGAFSQANLRSKEDIAAAKANVAKLDDWGKWIDPESDCDHKIKDGILQILVPSGAYDLSAEQNRMNAPRVLRPIDDKTFVFEVKVDGKFEAKDSVVVNRRGYHGAGVLLMADAKNYIRLERATFGDNHYVNFELRNNGRPSQFGNIGESEVDPTKPIWLRLAVLPREAIGGYHQGDGNWKYLDRRVAWEAKVRFDGSVQSVGVAVVNSSSAKIEPFFSEQKFSTDEALLEKIDEDSL